MKILYKIFILKKNIIRRLLIFGLLLSFIFIILNIKDTISELIFQRMNTPENKTITIVLEDDVSIDEIKNVSYIKSIEESDETIIIEFNYYMDVEKFMKDYKDSFKNITINYVSNDDLRIIEIIGHSLSIAIIASSIILFILTILNIIEVILEEKKEIVLYKILGFDNRKICLIFLKILIVIYTIVTVISIIFSVLFCLIINLFLSFINISFKIMFFKIINYINIYIILVCIIVITSVIMYMLVKKITPINLKNNSDF